MSFNDGMAYKEALNYGNGSKRSNSSRNRSNGYNGNINGDLSNSYRSNGSNESNSNSNGNSNGDLSRSMHSVDNADASYKSAESGGGRTLFSHVTSYSAYDNSSQPSRTSKSAYVNPVVAAKEQRAVFLSRLVVFFVLFFALAVVGSAMFLVVSRNERQQFESEFFTSAAEVKSLVQDNCQSAVDSAEAFSVSVTSSANQMNMTWPYVTIADFSSKAARLSTLSGAYQIGFAPIVFPEHFATWSVHSYLDLPSYYEELIEVEYSDETITVPALLNITTPFVWHHDPLSGTAQRTDPLETVVPQQLVGLRERIGFNGFFVNWQSLEPMYNLYNKQTMISNLNLLYSGFEDALATSYEFKIPALDSYRNPVIDPITNNFVKWESQTQMVQPIFDTIYNGKGSRKDLRMVGVLNMLFDWESLLSDLLSKSDTSDIDIVLGSQCSLLARPVTYRVSNDEVIQIGSEDLHDPLYDEMFLETTLFELDLDEETQAEIDRVKKLGIEATVEGGCISEVIMRIYPTRELEESFYTGTAWKLTGGVAAVFVFTSVVFMIYDIMVNRRQSKVMERIIRQDKIVLNTFPKAIRDKLYRDSQHLRDDMDSGKGSQSTTNNSDDPIFGSGQLADLYPSATVVFADIVGFTAWSSAREPNQVFKLLETIYKEFDRLAYRNNIFKVETVGDCYVAVAGVPEKCDDHAISVTRFSRDCMHKMSTLVRKLEILLGPDTADLQLRIGINTGQVTAGVLRGDKARFQLFGDTVNTASRMETTSRAGCIHVSSSTADELTKAGRQRWLRPREETVLVKGKGQMQTFYCETVEESIHRSKLAKYKKNKSTDVMTSLASTIITEEETMSDDEDGTKHNNYLYDGDMSADFEVSQKMSKSDRLVEWNVEILSYLLKQIMVARPQHMQCGNKALLAKFERKIKGKEQAQTTVLDEFQEIIELPCIASEELLRRKHPGTIHLDSVVVEQLRDLLKNIASMYNENAFHNFEHASHVTASVRKLLTRIVDADNQRGSFGDKAEDSKLEDLSGHSYGITSDPLTQFAVVFSAVIHDADHPGVPNAQLVKENTRTAQIYKKSIAEQNSVELVWDLLMSSAYDDLRSCIYSSEEELKRFRQLVVNTVMATDIVDKELQNLRKMRWEKAFSSAEELAAVSTPQLDVNRKATIVIEHLIQASDVSHTMQHWNIYKKWNQRFFFELYDAYKNGRAETDPTIGWYKGEIGFYDFYIIPLAKKLENCGVFGVSSHEYLNYAQSNRDQWVREGEQVVKEFVENYDKSRDPTLKSVV